MEIRSTTHSTRSLLNSTVGVWQEMKVRAGTVDVENSFQPKRRAGATELVLASTDGRSLLQLLTAGFKIKDR